MTVDRILLALAALLVFGCASEPSEPLVTTTPSVQIEGGNETAVEAITGDDDPEGVGRTRLEQGDWNGALIALRLAEDRHPERVLSIRLDEARALYALHMNESSLALLDTIVAGTIDPVLARQALALSGANAVALGRLEQAESDLRRSLNQDDEWPGSTRALADLGCVLVKRGSSKEGVATLRRALERFEQEGDADGAAITRRNLVRAKAIPALP